MRNKEKILIAAIILSAAFFIAPKIVWAQVVINEIMYDLAKDDCVADGADTDREWVELYNNSNDPVNLSGGSKGWRFNDGSSHLLSESPAQGSMTILPDGYAILTADVPTFLREHSGFQGTIIVTAMSLKNATGTLTIFDSSGNKINEIAYQNSLGAKHNCKTLEWDGAALKESLVDGGTPGRANSVLNYSDATSSAAPSASPTATTTTSAATPTPAPGYQYSQKVFINEFVPWPETGAKEWVELVNSDNTTINLSGWQIDDGNASTSPQTLPADTIIAPGDFLVISFNKNVLNNDNDKVRLLWPDDQVVHVIEYSKATQGQAVAKFDAGWLWTNRPTPGQTNKKSLTDSQERAPTIQIANAEKITPTEESVSAPVKIAQSTPAPKSAATITTALPTATAIPDAKAPEPNLLAAASEPTNTTKNNGILTLAGVIFLSALAAGGLIYFRRQKSPPDPHLDI